MLSGLALAGVSGTWSEVRERTECAPMVWVESRRRDRWEVEPAEKREEFITPARMAFTFSFSESKSWSLQGVALDN
jgi:hypothetical protein